VNITPQIKTEYPQKESSVRNLEDVLSVDFTQLEPQRGISIIGGHYCVSPDLSELSNNGESEINSFQWACDRIVDAESAGIPATLILFVNDIGISADSRKTLTNTFSIPDNYVSILENSDIDLTKVVVIFESSIRNRASKEVRKMKKTNANFFEIMPSNDPRLIRCIDPAYCEIPDNTKEAITVLGPNGEFLVVKEGSNPKCNTILAVLFDRVASEYHDGLIVNCFNTIYKNRLSLGTWVYNLICTERGVQTVPTVNLFFDEDGLVL